MPGVSEVEANPRVGSLLVLYAAAVTAVEKMMNILSFIPLSCGQLHATDRRSALWRGGLRRTTAAFLEFMKKLTSCLENVLD